MKLLILILTFMTLTNLYGQSYPSLEKTLKIELPSNSNEDGRWVFYSDKANIEKVEKPLVKTIFPSYDIYKVTLTNYLGWHRNQGTCVVLFDSSKSKIILVEPLWFGGTSKNFVKLFIGKKFDNKDSIVSYVNCANEVLQIGSGYKYRLTSSSDTLITYDLGYFKDDTYTSSGSGITSTTRYNEDGVWRKIFIDIKDNKIIRYSELNPKTNEKEIIE